MESRLLRRYLGGQLLLILAFFFTPDEGWLHASWQVAVGWAGTTFVLIGVRRFKPGAAFTWYALGASIFLNASSVMVEMIVNRVFHVWSAPSPADIFYLSLFPGLLLGLGSLIYRRSAGEDLGTLLLNTLVCALIACTLAIVAWEFIVWQTHNDPSIGMSKRIMVAVYPLGDLIVMALLLRLVFTGGARNAAFGMLVLALCFFLAADVGWAAFLRSGESPGPASRHLLEMTSMSAFALVGGAALHPAMRQIERAEPAASPRVVRWVALFVAIFTAPAVLMAQALLDHWYSVSSF